MSIEQPTPEQPSELEVFQEEIEVLKQKEKEGDGSIHLIGEGKYPEVNPTELTDEDREIWIELQNEALSEEKFKEYQQDVIKDGNQSRHEFSAMVANLLFRQTLKKNLAQD